MVSGTSLHGLVHHYNDEREFYCYVLHVKLHTLLCHNLGGWADMCVCVWGRGAGRGFGDNWGWVSAKESVQIFDLPGEVGICAQPIQNLCL